jgi:hypothetical protein
MSNYLMFFDIRRMALLFGDFKHVQNVQIGQSQV